MAESKKRQKNSKKKKVVRLPLVKVKQYVCHIGLYKENLAAFIDDESGRPVTFDFSNGPVTEKAVTNTLAFKQFITYAFHHEHEHHVQHRYVLEGPFLRNEGDSIILDGLSSNAKWYSPDVTDDYLVGHRKWFPDVDFDETHKPKPKSKK